MTVSTIVISSENVAWRFEVLVGLPLSRVSEIFFRISEAPKRDTLIHRKRKFDSEPRLRAVRNSER